MGKFQKGKPKTGGRQKGVPNKRKSIFESLEEIVTEDGHPVDVVKLFFESIMSQPAFQRSDTLIDFMKFLYPQQKSLEIGNKDEEGFKVVIEDYSKK